MSSDSEYDPELQEILRRKAATVKKKRMLPEKPKPELRGRPY